MDKGSCFKIGFILKPHGLKGSVSASWDSDAPEDVDSLTSVFLEIGGDLVPYFIESLSATGQKAFIKFEDVDTIEDAEAISKTPIYLPRQERPKSVRGEFYDDDVTGFLVIDENLGELGKITGVMNAGPNRLLELDHGGKELLIPVNSPFIRSLNKGKKTFTVSLPEGFLDI
jgi:16S rRNA processing protein RimM